MRLREVVKLNRSRSRRHPSKQQQDDDDDVELEALLPLHDQPLPDRLPKQRLPPTQLTRQHYLQIMYFTKVVAVAMTAVGLVAPAVAAPVPEGGVIVFRQQDHGGNGPGCEPAGACAGLPPLVKGQQDFVMKPQQDFFMKPQQDFVGTDHDLVTNTAGTIGRRQQDDCDHGHCCEPAGDCGGIPPVIKRQQDFVNTDHDLVPNTAGVNGKRGNGQADRFPMVQERPGRNPDLNGFVNWDSRLYSQLLGLPHKGQQLVTREIDPVHSDPHVWGKQAGTPPKRDNGHGNPDKCDLKSECGGPMGMHPRSSSNDGLDQKGDEESEGGVPKDEPADACHPDPGMSVVCP